MAYVPWMLIRIRLQDDKYAMQLINERELQLATLAEHAERQGRTFTTFELVDDSL